MKRKYISPKITLEIILYDVLLVSNRNPVLNTGEWDDDFWGDYLR